MSSKQFLASFFAIYCCAFQVIEARSCIEDNPIRDFQPNKYFGEWFKYIKSKDAPYGEMICTRYEIVINMDYEQILLQINWVDPSDNTEQSKVVEATINATAMGSSQSGFEYSIIDTDYDNYSIIFGCDKDELSLFVITRAMPPPADVQEDIKYTLDVYGITEDDIQYVKHDDCPTDEDN